MSTFTKEQLIEQAKKNIEVLRGAAERIPGASYAAVIHLKLAEIALASLEAEAVCVIDQSNLDYLKSGADADVWPASRTEMGDVLLYRTAPPAPANAEPVAWLWSHRQHPSEVTLVRPEDDEQAEGAHWSGWSCQALYAAPPAPVSDSLLSELLSIAKRAADEADEFAHAEFSDDSMEHSAAIADWERRAAMLQGAENAESPTTMQTAPSLDSSQIIAESPSGNSPVIPDCSCGTCRPVTFTDSRFVVCSECGNKRCPHANDHRNACTGSNEPGQEGSAYAAAPQQEVK
ncbi:hypothetical protein WCO32_13695 [Enterobacter hormaechei]|uniref:hypothetical protein n=1 Tax=Enterobacter hormaechei TaxID=158836 RepID=UPI0030D6090F